MDDRLRACCSVTGGEAFLTGLTFLGIVFQHAFNKPALLPNYSKRNTYVGYILELNSSYSFSLSCVIIHTCTKVTALDLCG